MSATVASHRSGGHTPMNESSQDAETPDPPLSRRARRAAQGDTGFRLNAWPFVIAAVVVVLLTAGLLWWYLSDRGPALEEDAGWEWNESPLDGVHARDVPPEDWETGWCLSGFTDEDSPADVVDCQQRYDAQVLLRRDLQEEAFPGPEVIDERARQWCYEDIELNPDAVAAADYDLQVQVWSPTESTWNSEDDRMVACFLTHAEGETLSGDFLEEPEESPEDQGEEEQDDEDSGDSEPDDEEPDDAQETDNGEEPDDA